MMKEMLNRTINKRVESVGFINLTMFPAWARLLIWSLQLPKNPYMLLVSRLVTLWKTNGPKHLVLYLKEATRIIQAFVSGNPVFCTEFPISLKGGLPSIIPGPLRLLMRQRDLNTFRGVLSVLAVYRVIQIPGKLKLETITEPFKGQDRILPQYEVKNCSSEIFRRNILLKPIKLLRLGTAGPNHPVSMLGISLDIKAWSQNPLFPSLEKFISLSPGGEDFLRLIKLEIEFVKDFVPCKPLILGRLSEKMEAAGKVRVFAITDSITQSVLRPLSDGIFKILRSLPMDGTFDQDAPVKRLLGLHKEGLLDGHTFYSYDLSAATDRLPIDFQVQVLTLLIGKDRAELWRDILCSRDWYHKGKPLRYSVGQPMGALSSWAMLALSHHVIVRIAANRVGYSGFSNYALLGDDIVIANDAVAKSYHSIMTQILGVEINLSKSMISCNSFEFAKRIVTLDGEVSPVGPKNLLVGLKTLKGIPSILLDLINKGVSLSEDAVTNLYKSIPTVRKSQLEKIVWLVKGPFGFVPTAEGLSADIQLYDSLSVVCIDRLADSFDEAIYLHNRELWLNNLKKMDELKYNLLSFERLPGFVDVVNPLDSPLFNHLLELYEIQIDELLVSEPQCPLFRNNIGVCKLKSWTWKPTVMKALTDKIKSDQGSTFLPLDPFREDRVILPLAHSNRVQNFWIKLRELVRRRSSFKFSGSA
ncbi:putative RNA-dependent RNA polymerase [Leptosphaeria biglobosa mitovirus 3]|nr:putative RNA-dependent RNA polymerase [Leptosphaeria biglobosa mitovirus 3]